MPWAGPAQCRIWGAAGRQDARAGEKAPWMRNAVLTRLPWPDSIFLMPLVAQLAAGFGSLAVRSIRNAAKWTRMPGVPPWRRTLAAPRLPWPQFRVPVGSGAPGRKHDYSRGAPGPRPVRCRRFARASGKTAEWTRTPGFRLVLPSRKSPNLSNSGACVGGP
jgi:hypothetical protein